MVRSAGFSFLLKTSGEDAIGKGSLNDKARGKKWFMVMVTAIVWEGKNLHAPWHAPFLIDKGTVYMMLQI